MYTLRTITKDGVQRNDCLGDNYSIVHRDYNYDKFALAFKAEFGRDHVADTDPESDSYTKDCYAILLALDGSKVYPLYKKTFYFIMSDSGKTFDNLSYKR